MTTSSLTLPVVTIQNTFPEVLQEVQEGIIPHDKFWVSCYKTGETSIHAKVNAELDDRDRNLVVLKAVDGDVEVTRDIDGNYNVACKSLGIHPTKILTPVQEYKDQERANPARPHRITAFDVSPDSSRFATGYLDGSIFLYPTSSFQSPPIDLVPKAIDITKSRTTSRPHLSGVTSLKFFPSSRVLLSTGLDFSLTVLPADLPDAGASAGARVTPVRTMRAHVRSVTDTAIIALGRNVVSSSLDSTVKLWDVSSGEVITSLLAKAGVSSMSIGDRPPVPPDGEEHAPPTSKDARELPETASKVVFCGLESGSFEVFDLGFKKSVYTSQGGNGSVTSIAYSDAHSLLATGTEKGNVTMYDTRSFATPLTSFRRLDTSIEDLTFIGTKNGGVGLVVATSDGLPYVASVVPEGPAVHAELVGADCDPVKKVTVRLDGNRTDIWSASDDGIVRRYAFGAK
ncbi:WD40 repeat-like protein [Pholiota conissans]|uniref:WD40 repeat-like protein n=1 Tax=Pholiota conissans TaxID=109636 RepID=A0A9P5Z6G3_9AGAR|nr:WD40 repeat-like protein [Pholiota conissans]